MWWWIIRIILKSGVFPLNMESTGKTTRRRPLQICAASVLAIAHIVCTKSQEFDSPVGSMVKRITPLINSISALPLIYAMQYQWLVTLSFIDDRILDTENIVEFIFPPSKRLFNKIDDLVYTAECLPEKFDHVMNSFPLLIHRFPLPDWVLLRIISWLTHWGSKDNSSTREKEIKIDMNYSKSESGECYPVDNSQEPSNAVQTEQVKRSEQWNKTMEEAYCPDESPCASSFESATSSPVSVLSQDETKTVGEKGKSDNLKCSYKEILERGTNGNTENEVTDALEECGWEKDGKIRKEGSILKDQIMELFDTSRPLN